MLSPLRLRRLIEEELLLDRTDDDVTTRLLGREGERPAKALIRAREEGVFCGKAVVEAFQSVVGNEVALECLVPDGAGYRKGDDLIRLEASVARCLTLERTLLNVVSHLCGVASLTRRFVEAIKPFPTKILATRKTLPGLRDLQLYAVEAGGGSVHRRSLSDGILIKDNHVAIVGEKEILRRARSLKSPLHRVEIEVQTLEALTEVLESPPDVIMLDNMDTATMKKALEQIAGRSEVEVSGGVSLSTVKAAAELGVDYISVGALTHSVRQADLTMDFVD